MDLARFVQVFVTSDYIMDTLAYAATSETDQPMYTDDKDQKWFEINGDLLIYEAETNKSIDEILTEITKRYDMHKCAFNAEVVWKER